jgi:hypothetical protein
MSTTPRNLPRFLPTLTEIVHPSEWIRAPDPESPDSEEMVRSVMQRMDSVIQRRLAEDADAMVRTLVTEQLPILRAGLRQELEGVVRQAVSEAMTSPADLRKSKK